MLYEVITPFGQGSAVFDGIYRSVEEAAVNGVNACRSVVAVIGGTDAGSVHTPDEIITLANRNRVRVFIVGLGTGFESETVELICARTGGRFYTTGKSSLLGMVYNEIMTIIRNNFV